MSTETASMQRCLRSLFPKDRGWVAEEDDPFRFQTQASRVLKKYWSDSVVTGRRAYVTVYQDAYVEPVANKWRLFMSFHLRSMSPSFFYHVPGWTFAEWLITMGFNEEAPIIPSDEVDWAAAIADQLKRV